MRETSRIVMNSQLSVRFIRRRHFLRDTGLQALQCRLLTILRNEVVSMRAMDIPDMPGRGRRCSRGTPGPWRNRPGSCEGHRHRRSARPCRTGRVSRVMGKGLLMQRLSARLTRHDPGRGPVPPRDSLRDQGRVGSWRVMGSPSSEARRACRLPLERCGHSSL